MRAIFLCLLGFAASCSAQNVGHVENFTQKGGGPDHIVLEWDFVEGDDPSSYPLHKYTLVIDGDISQDNRCPLPHCEITVEYLDSCTEYSFDLTPHFDDLAAGGDVLGGKVSTTGRTDDEVPGPPTSLVVTEDTEDQTSVQWQAPSLNPKCADRYQVCLRLDEEESSDCTTTSGTAFSTADGLNACGLYHVTVTPVTPTGILGPPLEETIATRDGVPGSPEDVVVGLITQETVQLMWNDPLINPLCVFRYAITYGKTHSSVAVSRLPGAREEYQHHATISPLDPCTNYTIDIVAVNRAELSSPKVTRFAATEETEPVGLPVVSLDPSGTDSIDVSWGANEDDSCAGHFEICWLDGQHPIEVCENVTTGGDGNFTITDLLPCTHYDVVVTVVSPGGLTSTPTANSTSTGDVEPSPVVDLQVSSVGANEISVSFDPPEKDPQCVSEYVIDIVDQDQSTAPARRRLATTPYVDNTINSLRACTNYLVRVCTRSPGGKMSPWQRVSARTLEAVPSEPRMLGASAFNETSVSLQWFQPEANPRCVSRYELRWEGDGASHSVAVGPGFKVTHVVAGLTPCVEYVFGVTAESGVGEGTQAQFAQSTKC